VQGLFDDVPADGIVVHDQDRSLGEHKRCNLARSAPRAFSVLPTLGSSPNSSLAQLILGSLPQRRR
jgi:hypothetical protein